MGSLSLLQQISPAQELNRGLLHCRRILYSGGGGDDIPTSQGWMRIEALSCKALSTALAHRVKRQPPSHPHWTLFCAPQGAGRNSQVALCIRTQRALTLKQQVVKRRRKFLKPAYFHCFLTARSCSRQRHRCKRCSYRLPKGQEVSRSSLGR